MLLGKKHFLTNTRTEATSHSSSFISATHTSRNTVSVMRKDDYSQLLPATWVTCVLTRKSVTKLLLSSRWTWLLYEVYSECHSSKHLTRYLLARSNALKTFLENAHRNPCAALTVKQTECSSFAKWQNSRSLISRLCCKSYIRLNTTTCIPCIQLDYCFVSLAGGFCLLCGKPNQTKPEKLSVSLGKVKILKYPKP